MERYELDAKLNKLLSEYNKKKKEAIIDFCDKNNPYKVGDVFEDHVGKIIIEKIDYYFAGGLREYGCVYFGFELKKDGTKRKDLSKRWAYQSNKREG